jgi:hypothetical protein
MYPSWLYHALFDNKVPSKGKEICTWTPELSAIFADFKQANKGLNVER